MKSFSYDDIDKKIQIKLFGIVFDIDNINEKTQREYEEDNSEDKVDKFIEKVIGKGSIEKINSKREEDGYKELTIEQKATMLGFIFSTYVDAITNNITGGIEDTFNNLNNRVNFYNNRDNRRNYNRGYRKNYRR